MEHLGTKTIETERLILRAFKESDAKLMFNNWASDDRVTKYLTWKSHENIENTITICKLWEEQSKEKDNYLWAIVLKENNNPIGSIGLVELFEETRCGEIGYCIGYDYWGKGIIKEAIEAVVKYLKLAGFVRLQAVHDVKNPNSGKVLLKTEFEKEGILKKYTFNNDKELIDVVIYSLIIEENLWF